MAKCQKVPTQQLISHEQLFLSNQRLPRITNSWHIKCISNIHKLWLCGHMLLYLHANPACGIVSFEIWRFGGCEGDSFKSVNYAEKNF